MSATSPTAAPSFRGRIGRDARSGHYAVPRRYRLHLSPSCPRCLRIAVTHSLLRLGGAVPVTLLPAVPDETGGGYSALRPLYEASSHRHPGAAVAPVLSDDWTGRIVSTDADGILRDLARRFGGDGPDLYPPGAEAGIEAVGLLCERGIAEAVRCPGRTGAGGVDLGTLLRSLDALEQRLARGRYVLGGGPTAADVHVWATLVRLDTVHRRHLDAAAVRHVAGHPRLWAYARRLTAHPAFGPHLDPDGIARGHRARCRGPEGAGAAVHVVDWRARTAAGSVPRPAERTRPTPPG
ncbi:glutathione S-transferase C-terminal domain-containing protein [Streptomyces sp. KL2]|uniref:glutathione S-transferase C-terminal domain-containing protein n=1 Tax=Streptomyces sp. KL2 TaxID=3050126 RepID=UPI0039783E51